MKKMSKSKKLIKCPYCHHITFVSKEARIKTCKGQSGIHPLITLQREQNLFTKLKSNIILLPLTFFLYPFFFGEY